MAATMRFSNERCALTFSTKLILQISCTAVRQSHRSSPVAILPRSYCDFSQTAMMTESFRDFAGFMARLCQTIAILPQSYLKSILSDFLKRFFSISAANARHWLRSNHNVMAFAQELRTEAEQGLLDFDGFGRDMEVELLPAVSDSRQGLPRNLWIESLQTIPTVCRLYDYTLEIMK